MLMYEPLSYATLQIRHCKIAKSKLISVDSYIESSINDDGDVVNIRKFRVSKHPFDNSIDGRIFNVSNSVQHNFNLSPSPGSFLSPNLEQLQTMFDNISDELHTAQDMINSYTSNKSLEKSDNKDSQTTKSDNV